MGGHSLLRALNSMLDHPLTGLLLSVRKLSRLDPLPSFKLLTCYTCVYCICFHQRSGDWMTHFQELVVRLLPISWVVATSAHQMLPTIASIFHA